MKTKIILLSLLFASYAYGGNDIIMTVASNKNMYQADDVVIIDITLTNTSKHDYYVSTKQFSYRNMVFFFDKTGNEKIFKNHVIFERAPLTWNEKDFIQLKSQKTLKFSFQYYYRVKVKQEGKELIREKELESFFAISSLSEYEYERFVFHDNSLLVHAIYSQFGNFYPQATKIKQVKNLIKSNEIEIIFR